MKTLALATLIFSAIGCSVTEPTDAVVAVSDSPASSADNRDKTDPKAAAKSKPESSKPDTKAKPATPWTETYAKLLKKYVAPDGVRYAAWKANPSDLADLQSVVDAISASSDNNLAFYLNAYNAWILHQILEDYPTDGPGGGNDLGRTAFFATNKITVGGNRSSFNNLESDIIRKRFKEPRIHFALNCASSSCPPLMNKPFEQSYLDTDLTRLTRAFLNHNPEGLRKSGANTYSLSEIFTWFGEDFGDVRTFINKYRTEPIPPDATIESHVYSWSLNAAS